MSSGGVQVKRVPLEYYENKHTEVEDIGETNINQLAPEEIIKKYGDLTNYEISIGRPFYGKLLLFYEAVKWVKENSGDWYIIPSQANEFYAFNYDYKQSEQILIAGNISFTINDRLYTLSLDINSGTVSFSTRKGDITQIKQRFENLTTNVFQGRLLKIYETNMGDNVTVEKSNDYTFDDVILDSVMKEDIFDNTIFHIENMEGNNGIILYGDPGGGKSMMCSAIMGEALKRNITVFLITNQCDYTGIKNYIEKFSEKTLVIFEDIDSIAQNRKEVLNSSLSELLQFINGISDINSKVVFIATTNYIEHLDEAIKNRPMRFNRKYAFNKPDEVLARHLIQKYFKTDKFDKYAKQISNDGFTGSHIKEMCRTYDMIKLKTPSLNDIDVFEKTHKIVKDNFKIGPVSFGFSKRDA